MTGEHRDNSERSSEPSMSSGSAESSRSTGPDVSVVVLTLNEEINIEECLASCAFSDDVHVLDSGSTDQTCDRAEMAGATVHYHAFESFGAQRNWAIDNIDMKHDWVFHLDADERFTPEIIEEIERLLERVPSESGFYVLNKLMFMGRWIKRSSGYPAYQMRLFHKERMRFCDYGHAQREEPGRVIGFLKEPYLHYSFCKGLHDWFEKHNRYSSLEARTRGGRCHRTKARVEAGVLSRADVADDAVPGDPVHARGYLRGACGSNIRKTARDV